MTAVNQQHVSDREAIDLGEMFRTILSQWKLMVLCVMTTLSLAVLYLRMTPTIYSVDGLVQIENSQSSTAGLLSGNGLTGLVDVKSPADTEIQLLKSRFVLGQVVRNLNLDVGVSSDYDRWYQRLMNPVKQKVSYEKEGVGYSINGHSFLISKFEVPEVLVDHSFELKFVAKDRYTLTLLNTDVPGFADQSVIKGVVGQLLTVPVGASALQLLIQSQTDNTDLASIYLSKKSLLRSVQNLNDNLFISENGKQTGILSLVYQGADRNYLVQTLDEIMRVYLEKNVLSRTEETQSTLVFLEKQLPKLRSQLETSESLYNKFREKNNTIDPTKEAELLLEQSVALKTKKIELEQQNVMLSQKYTSSFPLIGQIQAQVDAIDQNAKELEQRVVGIPELQRQYLQLYRDVQVNTVLYTSLLNSYEQLKVVKASKVANVRILDQALKSANPIKPRKSLILLFSVFAGLVISAVLMVLKSFIYSGVKDSDQIEAQTGLSVLATVPRSLSQRKLFLGVNKKKGLLALEDPEDLAVESLRSLRTQVHFSAAKDYNNIILITGPAPGIGKSFISVNFAAVFAQMGKSVVLVDADMRRGHLGSYLNIDKNLGLADYLIGDQYALDEVCTSTSVDGLDFISKGTTPLNPAELLLTERFQDLMNELSQKYDYVIIDSPPILAATDGAIIARVAGMALVVVRYGETHMRELELTLARLSQAGASVQGVVFNDVIANGTAYGYQYAYQYRATK